MKPITIAIDGYSSSGKSTLAKAIAKALEYTYIDSGAMYRAVTLYMLRKGYFNDSVIMVENLIRDFPKIEISFVLSADGDSVISLNGEIVESEIREMEVSNYVSQVSKIAQVRSLLVEKRKLMGEGKAIVMDGRDIGSVVFPDAELKLFMTASDEIRAKRRYNELILKGVNVELKDVKKNLSKRDYMDTHRKIAPLIQTTDSLLLDTSNLNQKQQLEWVIEKVNLLILKYCLFGELRYQNKLFVFIIL